MLFNPSKQCDYCRNLERVYMGVAPSLSVLSAAFGKDVTETWLEIQIRNLSEFCGVREKISTEQTEELAKVIISQFHYLKVTELMHFFLRFKAGAYGRFYGSVDAMVITDALQTFCEERNSTIEKYEAERTKQETEARNKADFAKYIDFRAKLARYGVTIDEWSQNRDLFDGTRSKEQIRQEIALRATKSQANG